MIPDTQGDALDRSFSLELARVTERAAIAAAKLRGRGNEKAADQAAVDAMRKELNALSITGTVVIGEGERDEAPMLYIGETVGRGDGPNVDIALDPLEGKTVCAKNLPNSLSVLAMAPAGSLLKAPDVYMEKIAIGPGYPAGIVDLNRSPADNLAALAEAKGVAIEEVTVCILDRPRNARLIDDVRVAGASIRLIGDGDVASVIHAANPADTGIDVYMGIGGAPEGVLAAAALRCTGGQMQGRLMLNTHDKRARAQALGITDPDKIYCVEEMASGDVLFAATGVTDGSLLDGVRFAKGRVTTHTLMMRSETRTIRDMRAQYFLG